MTPADDITGLLLRWNAGDRGALEQLTPLVYSHLKGTAHALLAHEKPGHTLSATALVHETYLRLIDQRRVNWENRAHFYGAAANIMRRVLVDHAKKKMAAKRGGSSEKVAIKNDIPASAGFLEEVISLDAALENLAVVDARKTAVVEMKFFAGMTNAEIAQALGISSATVERDWTLARAWLIRALSPALRLPE